jgi:hypothetical protein
MIISQFSCLVHYTTDHAGARYLDLFLQGPMELSSCTDLFQASLEICRVTKAKLIIVAIPGAQPLRSHIFKIAHMAFIRSRRPAKFNPYSTPHRWLLKKKLKFLFVSCISELYLIPYQ